MQRYLISTDKQELEDIRTMFLTHEEICVPHKEDVCWYCNVITGNNENEFLLCVLDDAEQYLTEPQLTLLLDIIPENFIDPQLI